MAVDGVHYLALSRAKERYAQTMVEVEQARQSLNEAVKLGDLSENSEYDAAKANVGRLSKELDELAPVRTMQAVRANDRAPIIEEGSVVRLVVYSVTDNPQKPGSPEFEAIKERPPEFDGILCYGATLSFHELLQDSMLSVDTPVGQFLLGKQPGDYSVPVPAGFASVGVTKLNTGEVTFKDLYCKLRGERCDAQR